jgi:CHAT domain-containing protein
LIGLYLDARRPYDALAMAERVKGRVLLDALRRGKVEVTKSMTASEKEREKALNARIATLNRELLRQRPGTPGEAAVRARLEETQRQGRQFETELYATHPELRAQRAEFEPLSKPQMLALAPDEQTALVEFAVLHEAVITFVLTREGSELALRVHENKIEDQSLRAEVEALRKQIVGRDPGYRKAAAKLYARLLGAAEADLQGKKTIVVIPDDVLWRVPFPALITSRGRHLIEEKTIFYANSLAVLWEETQRARAPRAERLLLAMGNPTAAGEFAALPNAEKEAQALGKLYGHASTRVYVGAEAREDRFKSDASRFRIVHLATHGLLNDANPLYSYVLLSHGTDKEDGLLEAREILNLDLHADLVILSACQTAEGRISSGEGMIGMSWALQVAGSSAALVTQWSVDSESTTELMTGFHRRLRSRMQPNGDLSGKASALRDAAIDLMKSPQFRHPFYWSAFALVGAGY